MNRPLAFLRGSLLGGLNMQRIRPPVTMRSIGFRRDA